MNRITLQPTIFENHPDGQKTYGYRMYDDCDGTYLNTWKYIPESNLQILSQAMGCEDEISQGMFDHISEHESGIYIGSEWYGWDEIKHLFRC